MNEYSYRVAHREKPLTLQVIFWKGKESRVQEGEGCDESKGNGWCVFLRGTGSIFVCLVVFVVLSELGQGEKVEESPP